MVRKYNVTMIKEYHYYAQDKKILTRVLNNRLQKYTDHIIGEYQVGYRAGKSTMDQIFTAKNLLEKAWEYSVGIHQIFIAFQRAYNSIQTIYMN
jgi:hypothetical protein